MTQQTLLESVQQSIQQQFSGEGTGHDYFHVERVVKIARRLAVEENADLFLVELAAWLHDVGDSKLHNGVDCSREKITVILKGLGVEFPVIEQVIDIVSQVSFSKGKTAESIEAKIVQDADRLDALGAIGVARTFAFGGSRQNEIYNPVTPEGSSIQHFYDKLLKLKELLNTNGARQLAADRHRFLENFLQQFYREWNGEC